MKNQMFKHLLVASVFVFSACSGLKVVRPVEKNKDEGTLMLDWSGGAPKFVGTYSCSLVSTSGKRISAIGKSEEEARRETLARCKDEALVTFCQEKNVRCVKN